MQIRRRKLFVRDVLTSLFRQRKVERSLFLLVLGGTFVGNYLLTPTFESHATLLVAPTASSEPEDIGAAREAAIRFLQDPDFLRIAADEIGVAELNRQAHQGLQAAARGALRKVGTFLYLVPEQTASDWAITYLDRHLSAEPGLSNRLIRVAFTATDGAFAQTALGEIGRAFVALHRRPAPSAQAARPSTRDTVAQAEARLDAFLAQHDPDQMARETERLAARADELRRQIRADRTPALMLQLTDIEEALSAARARHDELQRLEDDLLAISATAELREAADAEPEPVATGPAAFSVITQPTLPALPIAPQRLRNLTHALWIGVVVGVVGGFLTQWLDHTLLFPEDLEQQMGLPLLGSFFADEPTARRAVHLQHLCGRMRQPPGDLPSQVWLVTSVMEGAARIDEEIAQTLAEDPTARVLLLDFHHDAHAGAGFADLVLDRVKLDEVVTANGRDNLWRLPRGAPEVANPLLLASHDSEAAWAALRKRYTDIIVSAPPLLRASETVTVAGMCDAVLIVVRAEVLRREVLARACEILAGTRARVGGAILTNRRAYIPAVIYQHI